MHIRGAHKRFCVTVAVSAMLCSPAAAVTMDEHGEALKAFTQAEDWQGMKNYCQTQISQGSNHFLFYDCICNADTGLAQYDLSVKSCKAAGDLAAGRPAFRKFAGESYYHQGFSHLKRGEYEAAKDACTTTLKYNPALPEAYMCIGQSDFGPATNIHQKHAQSGKIDPSIYQLNSSEKKHMQKALAAYQRYTEMKADDAGGWYNVAAAYVFLDRYKEAIAPLERAFALNSEYPGVYFFMGFTYYITDDKEKFAALYQQAQQNAPKQARALSTMSALAKSNDKKDVERFRAQLLTMQ